jgi:predicted nucleic acid-binding protein
VGNVRFWDTSALLQIFNSSLPDHRAARNLWSGPRSGRFEHATSAVVVIETALHLHRAGFDKSDLLQAVDMMDVFAVDEDLFPAAFQLIERSHAGGADTATVACAVEARRGGAGEVELITADRRQGKLAQREGIRVTLLRGGV